MYDFIKTEKPTGFVVRDKNKYYFKRGKTLATMKNTPFVIDAMIFKTENQANKKLSAFMDKNLFTVIPVETLYHEAYYFDGKKFTKGYGPYPINKKKAVEIYKEDIETQISEIKWDIENLQFNVEEVEDEIAILKKQLLKRKQVLAKNKKAAMPKIKALKKLIKQGERNAKLA
jgi:hypothetical protein